MHTNSDYNLVSERTNFIVIDSPNKNLAFKLTLLSLSSMSSWSSITYFSRLHNGESIFRVIRILFIPMCNKTGAHYLHFSLNFFVITHIVDMYFWPTSGTHILHEFPYFQFLFSLHQSPLLFVFVPMWAKLDVFDNLFPVTWGSSLPWTTWSNWIFISRFCFYIQPMTIISSWIRLCTHNLSWFPLITSFHFISHNFASTCIFTVFFQFLSVYMKTFMMLSFMFFLQDFIYLIFGCYGDFIKPRKARLFLRFAKE